ncbi:uncharacterized protein V1516DRAFT_624270 [Lipomyces oligophaga]|uniref:uncharacterized protein n=1 Tax=Lipomyces oligophaga TaxID=45792 RepID=UPI0034CD1F6C
MALFATLTRSASFLTLVASLLAVISSFVVPYSRYLFSATFSWATFFLATFIPIDRVFIRPDAHLLTYRRIDVVVCSTCMVLSTACASLLGERGGGLSSILIPFLVHVLRFEYMSQQSNSSPTSHGHGRVSPDKHFDPYYITHHLDTTTLIFITFTSFLALAPSYPGASQLVFGMCSSVFAATYLSISDISIPLTRKVLREISGYTCLGLFLMSLLLDGKSGWTELGTSDGLAYAIFTWSIFSAVKNIIIMILIQQMSPVNASFIDLIGYLSTTLSSHKAWKVAAMCIAYMAIATTLLPPTIGDRHVKYLRIRANKLIIVIIGSVLLVYGIIVGLTPRSSGNSQRLTVATVTGAREGWNATIHPISYLMETNYEKFTEMKSRQTSTYPEAVKEYRRRYGINPPPNFDKWYALATEKQSVIFDDYNTIYSNLRPFWGMEPAIIRAQVRDALSNPDSHLFGIHIRGGIIANRTGSINGQWFQTAIENMITEFVEFLPDMDLAFNMLDSPRVVISTADMNAILQQSEPVSGTVNKFSSLPDSEIDQVDIKQTMYKTVFDSFAHQSSWNHARLSCPLNSPSKLGKKTDAFNNYAISIGFLKNTTSGTDVCLSSDYQHQHGIFVRPETFNIITDLVPIFSQSKLSTFSDIIFPSPSYFAERVPYNQTKDIRWTEKLPVLYWRGSSTGLRSRDGSWRLGHRQRTIKYFTAMGENCTMLVDISELDRVSQVADDSVTPPPRLLKRQTESISQEDHPQVDHRPIDHIQQSHQADEQATNNIDQELEELADGKTTTREHTSQQQDNTHFEEIGQQQAHEREHHMRDSVFVEGSFSKLKFKDHIDTRFSDFTQCDETDCDQQRAYFGPPAQRVNFQETWKYKFLLDMDGNSFSTRLYPFLKSKSLVIKQTLFREWHDERLVPWVHYVPLSLDLKEGFETLQFLLENDVSGRFMAEQSAKWMTTAIRKDDMMLYFFRLLLEYGRLVDDNRNIIGCV